jgi:hypothetical protein
MPPESSLAALRSTGTTGTRLIVPGSLRDAIEGSSCPGESSASSSEIDTRNRGESLIYTRERPIACIRRSGPEFICSGFHNHRSLSIAISVGQVSSA